MQNVAIEADDRADIAVGQIGNVLGWVEVLDVRPDLLQGLLGLGVVRRVVAMVGQPQVVEGDRQDLRRVVDDRHAALAELLDVLFVEEQVPRTGDVGAAENCLDLLDVVADAGGAPHVRKTVLVAGVVDLELFHQQRVEVLPVGQLAPVQGLDRPGLDQP
ncbi:hypothetical protein D9M71_490310 [compost metagenome]